ncbi:protein kinase C delta type [Xenopus laevis]|uniref:Protein kinase C delta type n=1 Tax=Xenopus laevis TaxID=8355 RepID=A0A8J1LWP6_XENLA|nr:protein kinase C delta type [Xenopus laevis]
MAPEVLQGQRYNAAVDWWALGIIMCQMASGDSPFYEGNDREKVISSIINDEPRIPRWLNDDLKDLLRKLLEKDPNQRLGAHGNIKYHPYFSSINWVELEWKKVPPPFQLRAVST